MIADLKPYPAMKDSGSRSLGSVPAHWAIPPIARIGRLIKGTGGSKEDEVDGGVPCVRYGDLYTQHEFFIQRSRGFVSPERARSYTQIRLGDVLFAASGETIEDIGRSAVSLIDGEATCGGDVIVLRPQIDVVPRYLGYAADSPASREEKAKMGRGFTVVHIYASELKRLTLPLPPVLEQAAIVRFLDYTDKQIRRSIRAKRKLIELLEEQKLAIIHRAVTRGLDPNVRLKPSGVEWLVCHGWRHTAIDRPTLPNLPGDVPEHWDLRGISPSHSERWVTPKDMKRFTIAASSMNVAAKALQATSLRLLPAGSVLLVVRGMILARRVPIARSVEPVTINQDMKAIVPDSGIDAGFLAYRMEAAQAMFEPLIDEAGHGTKRLPTERWKNVTLAIPGPDEQRLIVHYLDHSIDHLAAATNNANREMSLLREYRTRLIADVVTGKVDVREAAARLPDEAEEPEPLEEADALADADYEPADEQDLEELEV